MAIGPIANSITTQIQSLKASSYFKDAKLEYFPAISINTNSSKSFKFRLVLVDFKPIYRFNVKTGRKEYLMVNVNALSDSEMRSKDNCVFSHSIKACRSYFDKYNNSANGKASQFGIESFDMQVWSKIQRSIAREFSAVMDYPVANICKYTGETISYLDSNGEYTKSYKISDDSTNELGLDPLWDLQYDLNNIWLNLQDSIVKDDITKKWNNYVNTSLGNESGIAAFANKHNLSKVSFIDNNVVPADGSISKSINTYLLFADNMLNKGRNQQYVNDFFNSINNKTLPSFYMSSVVSVPELDAVCILTKEMKDLMKLNAEYSEGNCENLKSVMLGPYAFYNSVPGKVVRDLINYYNYYMLEVNIELSDYYGKNVSAKAATPWYLTRTSYVLNMKEYVPVFFKFNDIYHPVMDCQLKGSNFKIDLLSYLINFYNSNDSNLGMFDKRSGTILLTSMPKVNMNVNLSNNYSSQNQPNDVTTRSGVTGLYILRSNIPELFNGMLTPIMGINDVPLQTTTFQGNWNTLLNSGTASAKDYYSTKFFGGIIMSTMYQLLKESGRVDKDSLVPLFNNVLYKLEFIYGKFNENNFVQTVNRDGQLPQENDSLAANRFEKSKLRYYNDVDGMRTTLTSMTKASRVSKIADLEGATIQSSMPLADVRWFITSEIYSYISEYTMQTTGVIETRGVNPSDLFSKIKQMQEVSLKDINGYLMDPNRDFVRLSEFIGNISIEDLYKVAVASVFKTDVSASNNIEQYLNLNLVKNIKQVFKTIGVSV